MRRHGGVERRTNETITITRSPDAMATYPFLSDEWVTEAHTLREEFEKKGGPAPPLVKMNLVITEVPFGPGSIDAHLDTSEGSIKLELGHLDPARPQGDGRLCDGQVHSRGRQSSSGDAGVHGRQDQG